MFIAAVALWQGDPIEAFYAELRVANSATAVLQQRCSRPIRALVQTGVRKRPSAAQRARLAVSSRERVAYRLVRLMCGRRVLSVAENWYVPGRLTQGMRAALRRDTPFGVVIRPLSPTRANLSSRTDWPGRRHGEILRHRSLVRSGTGLPLAEVSEKYQAAALDRR